MCDPLVVGPPSIAVGHRTTLFRQGARMVAEQCRGVKVAGGRKGEPAALIDARAEIDRLTETAKATGDPDILRALVALRRDAAQLVDGADERRIEPIEPIEPPRDHAVPEVLAAELTVEALRRGLSESGCLLVRQLIDPALAAVLAAGIDAALQSYDASIDGSGPVDPAWYDPRPMPDRAGSGLPEDVHRRFLRSRGSMWTSDSPRMLFDLCELLDRAGIGALATELFGQRPLLSALKATLRRMPPDVEVDGRWHQDGAFLGAEIASLNIWLALTPCGIDSPGLDIVPRRVVEVVRDPDSRFDWSLSDATVEDVAGTAGVVRPEFAAGDALLFDHVLVHRTGASAGMVRARYAIETWMFPPSAYPTDQLPILY